MESRIGIDCTPEIDEWRRANPIRKWLDADPKLKRQRLELLKKTLGVSKQAINLWSQGVTLPSTPRLVAAMKVIRGSLPAYMRWWDRMPKGN